MVEHLGSEPHPGLAAAPPVRASGPDAAAEPLREAYLSLLRLGLVDLVGTTTAGVGRDVGGEVMSRLIAGDQIRLRAAGMDWPEHGLTMTGLARMENLQRCVEAVVADGVDGDLIEAGVWRGGSSMLMRATLDSLGQRERTVWLADSFGGFPEGRPEDFPEERELDDLGLFDFLSVSAEEVRESFERLGLDHDLRFVPGFFEETMPGLRGGRWALMRLDGDTYDATRISLECLYPNLSRGGYVVIDDYGALEECRQAVDDFRAEHGITEPLEEIDWTGRRWRREADEPIDAGETPAAVEPSGGDLPRRVTRSGDRPVPTMRELALERQVKELERGLGEAHTAISQLEAKPFNVVRSWLRRRLP